MLEPKWNIKKTLIGYYVTNDAGLYLDKHGDMNKDGWYFSSTVGALEAIKNYQKRNQNMTESWKVRSNSTGWFVGRGDGDYLCPNGTISSMRFFFDKESDAMEAINKWQQQQELPQAVDWSQPIQTDEKPPRKARLICSDRKSDETDRTHIVLIEIGKDEWVYYCNENGAVANTSFFIINVPAKVPYGREDWERLSRVRDREDQTRSYLVGSITNDTVVIGGSLYDMNQAATLFLTMDGQELYK